MLEAGEEGHTSEPTSAVAGGAKSRISADKKSSLFLIQGIARDPDNSAACARKVVVKPIQDRIMANALLSSRIPAVDGLRTGALLGGLIVAGSIALAGCQSRADTPPPGSFGPPTVSVAPAVKRQGQESDDLTRG